MFFYLFLQKLCVYTHTLAIIYVEILTEKALVLTPKPVHSESQIFV